MSDPDALALQRELDTIKKKVAAEGCSSLEEMISQLQTSKASLNKAEEARDKFSSDLEAARKNLGAKGGELGFLNQEVERLKSELEEAKKNPESNTQAEPTPKVDPPPVPSKTPEEELAEVESSLSEDQWKLADELLEAVEDDDVARQLVKNPAERVKFLKQLSDNPASEERPKSFRKKEEPKPPVEADTLVDQLMKKIGRVPIGPSSGAVPRRGSAKQPTRQAHSAIY